MFRKEEIDYLKHDIIEHFQHTNIYSGFGNMQPIAAVMIKGIQDGLTILPKQEFSSVHI